MIKKLLQCDESAWLTYYDQAHTTGTDIKQDLNARALVTFNKHSLLRDLLQGVMRLRQFFSSQNCDIVIPSDLSDIFGSPPTVEKIIALSIQNQESQVLKHHYISGIRKIQNLFRENLDTYLKDLPNNEQKLQAYKAFSEFFVTPIKIDPFLELGGIEEEQDTLFLLETYRKHAEQAWEKALKLAMGISLEHEDAAKEKDAAEVKIALQKFETVKKKLVKESKLIITKIEPYLPVKVKQRVLDNPDANMEAQKQSTAVADQKQEKESQLQTQAMIESAAFPPYIGYKGIYTPKSWSEGEFTEWRKTESIINEIKEKSEFSKLQNLLPNLDDFKKLGLEFHPKLLVSHNYQNTYLETPIISGMNKKPSQYILFKKDGKDLPIGNHHPRRGGRLKCHDH